MNNNLEQNNAGQGAADEVLVEPVAIDDRDLDTVTGGRAVFSSVIRCD